MIFRYTYHGGAWIDLENPTEDEVRLIVKEFLIDERLESELLSPTPTSVVAGGAHAIFLVMHFPAHGVGDGETKDQEVDFVVGHNFIVTVHYEVIESFHHLQKLLETRQIVSKHDIIETDVLLEVICMHLYTSVRDHVEHVVDRLTRIERDMFNDLEGATVRAISNINREFLHIDAALMNQEEPLARFLKILTERKLFGISFVERAERIQAERSQVARLAMTHRAVAAELRQTNMALLESRQNEIMKTLTTINVIVLPLELIAFVFGMHALGTPLENDPNAFWIIIALMFGTMGLMTLVFVRKHWLS